MEEIQNCPICQGKTFIPFLTCIDYTASKEKFKIVSCETCGFHFTNPRPEQSAIGKYYESEEYISHSNTNKGLVNKIYQLVKVRAIMNKIKLIESLNPPDKTLLDIGCGTGDFLGKSKENGWQVTGIEPNKKAAETAIKAYSITVYNEITAQLTNNQQFSVITLWHVLEHVHDLKNRIKEIYKLLNSNGLAIIAVPNYTSWDAKFYKEYWAAYDVPRHLYHFSPDIIKTLLETENLKFIKSLPMKMDSFYVSMLSEQYKKSTFGIIKALWVGFISNLKAHNNAEKYSSVIYVFRKR